MPKKRGLSLLLIAATLAALLLLSSCADIQIYNSCTSNADCKGGQFCIKGKCAALNIYKDLESAKPAAKEPEKKPPVLEGFELCENENPLFDPRWECQQIRLTKFSAWTTCDYTIGPPTWYNMGSCYDCIISCK